MRQYSTPPLVAAPQPSIDFICIPIAHLLIRDTTCHPVKNLERVISPGSYYEGKPRWKAEVLSVTITGHRELYGSVRIY